MPGLLFCFVYSQLLDQNDDQKLPIFSGEKGAQNDYCSRNIVIDVIIKDGPLKCMDSTSLLSGAL